MGANFGVGMFDKLLFPTTVADQRGEQFARRGAVGMGGYNGVSPADARGAASANWDRAMFEPREVQRQQQMQAYQQSMAALAEMVGNFAGPGVMQGMGGNANALQAHGKQSAKDDYQSRKQGADSIQQSPNHMRPMSMGLDNDKVWIYDPMPRLVPRQYAMMSGQPFQEQ